MSGQIRGRESTECISQLLISGAIHEGLWLKKTEWSIGAGTAQLLDDMALFLCLAAVVITSLAEAQPVPEPMQALNATTPNNVSHVGQVDRQKGRRGTKDVKALRGSRGSKREVDMWGDEADQAEAERFERSQVRSFGGRGQRAGWPASGGRGGRRGNEWGPWGHGVRGETCCMCSRRGRRGKTILFAAGDYDHFYGSRSAHRQCDRVCELQCAFQNGHKFGCYEEDDLLRMSRRYRGQANFVIRHERRYGNIC